MKKYEKPFARDLGELLPAFGDCKPGSVAEAGGKGDNCSNGGTNTTRNGKCEAGTIAADNCKGGTTAGTECKAGQAP